MRGKWLHKTIKAMKNRTNPVLKKHARALRKNATEPEKLMWHHLRNRQLDGLKFRRQEPIGNYIVDFVCIEKKIVVEIDGEQHALEDHRLKDKIRDENLTNAGFKILRFWNHEVLTNVNGVLERVLAVCKETLSP